MLVLGPLLKESKSFFLITAGMCFGRAWLPCIWREYDNLVRNVRRGIYIMQNTMRVWGGIAAGGKINIKVQGKREKDKEKIA